MSDVRNFVKTSATAVLGLFVLTSCAETSEPDPAPGGEPEAAVETVEQAVVDQDGPNWVTAGGGGRLELIGGEDGQPDVTSGRFVLDAQPIADASFGNGRWLVVGEGSLQALDSDATRLRPVREILATSQSNFIERGNTEWLAGGAGGQLQRIDDEGEPTLDVAEIFGGTTDVLAAGWNGTSWLVGTADGRTLKVERDLAATSAENTPFGGDAVVGVIGRPSGWIALSADSWASVTAVGNPSAPTEIEAGLQITEATMVGANLFIGTADGRVAAFDPATMTNSSGWQSIFATGEVSKITGDGNGSVVALSTEGQAAVLSSAGAVTTSAADIVPGLALEGAWFADGQWLMAAGPIGFVRFVGPDLSPVRTLDPLLGGEDILAASPNGDGMLLVGTQGQVQFVDSLGSPVGTVQSTSTTADLLDADWNGEDFLVVSADGNVELVGADGTPAGGATAAIDSGRISFASWSGEFWLVGGDGGKVQRVRANGTLADSAALDIPDMVDAKDARFSGTEWLVGGTTSDGVGIAARISGAGDLIETIRLDAFPGTIETVEYNGIEWFVAGTGGLFQRINAEGALVGNPEDLLNGYDVLTMVFNGQTLLAGGEFGAVRQFTQSLQPLRPALGVLDTRTVRTISWTAPRGFPEGPCLTETSCYVGPCVGGLNGGTCCDRACTSACESCFLNETGEPDGTCAPVAEGRRPPVKIHIESPGCEAQTPSSCGTTGTCDGAGACAYYEAGTLCGLDAQCSAVTFTPAQVCAGDGSACPEPAPVSCEPYTVCSVEDGCASTCMDDSDCFEDFVCENAQCVEGSDEMEMPDEPTDDEEDGGCCATAPAKPADDGLGLLVLLVGGAALLLRRRRA